MEAQRLSDLLSRRAASGQRYLEFLKAPTLSVGVYHLRAGEPDPQGPHTRDEVYYVLSGRASICVGDEVQPVEAGGVVYVAAGVEHRFVDITEDLDVLVFFAGAQER